MACNGTNDEKSIELFPGLFPDLYFYLLLYDVHISTKIRGMNSDMFTFYRKEKLQDLRHKLRLHNQDGILEGHRAVDLGPLGEWVEGLPLRLVVEGILEAAYPMGPHKQVIQNVDR